MRTLPILSSVLVWAALLLAGCGSEPSAEQRQADSTLTAARKALQNAQYPAARASLQEALKIDRRLGRTRLVAEELRLLGSLHAALAEFDSSLLRYEEAVREYKVLTDRPAIRSLTLEMASLHRLMGEERKAFTIYTEALRLATVFGDSDAVRAYLWALVPVCRVLDKREEESRFLMQLLTTSVADNDLPMQARVHREMGRSHLHRGELDAALEGFLRALTLADQGRDSLEAITALAGAAAASTVAGKTADAFQTYTEGLRRADLTTGARPLRQEMLIRVGNVYLRNRQFAEAARFFRAALNSALAEGDKLAEGYLFIQIGHCESESSLDAGIRSYQSALELFDGVSYARGSAYALLSLGVAALRANRLQDALDFFKSAVEQEEKCFAGDDPEDPYTDCEETASHLFRIDAYEGVMEMLLQSGKHDEAFLYQQRSRGRDLFLILSSLELQTRNFELTESLGEFRHAKAAHVGAERRLALLLSAGGEARAAMGEVRARLTQTATAMETLASKATAANTAYASAVRNVAAALPQVQRALAPGTALVGHIPTRRSLYAYAITATRFSVQVAAVPKERAGRLITDFTDLLQQRARAGDSVTAATRDLDRRIGELSTSLYSAFIRPLEGDLAGVSRLLVVPATGIPSPPVHALSRYPSRRLGPYLYEQYQVQYLPSAAALLIPSSKRTHGQDIVGLGHPGTTSWDVEYELRDIRAFHKDTRLYFEQQATLANLQREQGDVLHLAVELRFNPTAPSSSYLILSDGKAFNTTRQVLWGELTTLPSFSAIILSDLNDHRREAVLSAPQLLLMTGASTVIAASYPPARKTRKFFGEMFYTTFLAENPPASAFRQAILEMIKNPQYTSPHVWTPYQVWGK